MTTNHNDQTHYTGRGRKTFLLHRQMVDGIIYEQQIDSLLFYPASKKLFGQTI